MFGNGWGRRKAGWLAVVTQGRQLTLAHVIRGPGVRPEICLLESFLIEKSELEALQRLRSARDLKSYACTTLMPPDEYDIAQIDTPKVPREERKAALRWALKANVDYPLESACLDVIDIPLDAAGSQPGVFAVTAAEARVRTRAALFDAARIPLLAIDIAELAQRNVAALLEEKNRGLMFMRLDEAGGLLTLTFRGELIAARRIDVSALDLADADAERCAQRMERLVLELQRSLDNFDRQYSSISISRLVIAVSPPVDGLAAALKESINLPVREMDLSSVMDFSAIPELRDTRHQARNVLAIGAALRTTGDNVEVA